MAACLVWATLEGIQVNALQIPLVSVPAQAAIVPCELFQERAVSLNDFKMAALDFGLRDFEGYFPAAFLAKLSAVAHCSTVSRGPNPNSDFFFGETDHLREVAYEMSAERSVLSGHEELVKSPGVRLTNPFASLELLSAGAPRASYILVCSTHRSISDRYLEAIASSEELPVFRTSLSASASRKLLEREYVDWGSVIMEN